MKVTYSIDMHDSDGDCWNECILIHINNCRTILQLKNVDDLQEFIESLNRSLVQIKEEKGIE